MSRDDLDGKYERILEEGRLRGDLQDEPVEEERRRHPRIRVNPGDLPVEIDPWVFAIDVSISGMAFYSDQPVEDGERVTIALGNELAVDAEVVSSQFEPGDNPYLPSRYRLHCRFADEEQGKELLVRIKELEGKVHPTLAN